MTAKFKLLKIHKIHEIVVPVARYELQHEKDECGKTAKRW